MIIGTKYALFPTKSTTFLESISKVLFSCKIEKKNIVPNKVKNNLLGKPEKITLGLIFPIKLRGKAIPKATNPTFIFFTKPITIAKIKKSNDIICSSI